jgi:3-mercaptopyruvate sulfurtransferase SseA
LKGGLDAWEKKGYPVEAITAFGPDSVADDRFDADSDIDAGTDGVMDGMVTLRATAPK